MSDGHAHGKGSTVRVAWEADAPAIAAVQVRCWTTAYANTLPADLLGQMSVELFADRWAASLRHPPDGRDHVLLALDEQEIVGFATTGPSDDPDADPTGDALVAAFLVDPDHRRQGHGSRLLHAVADTAAADRFTRATIWVESVDDALRAFLEDSGWAPDGAHRELDLDGDGSVRVKQLRLHTAVGDHDDDD